MSGRRSPLRRDKVAGESKFRVIGAGVATLCLVATLLTACGGSSDKPTPTVTAIKRFIIVTPTPRRAGIDSKNTPVPVTYVVQPGDTLSLIATRYRVSEDEIQALNHLADPDSLYSGQRLLIPPATN